MSRFSHRNINTDYANKIVNCTIRGHFNVHFNVHYIDKYMVLIHGFDQSKRDKAEFLKNHESYASYSFIAECNH